MSGQLALPPPRRTLLTLDVYRLFSVRKLVEADNLLTAAIRYSLNLPFAEYDDALVEALKDLRADARHAAMCELHHQLTRADEYAAARKVFRRENKERRRQAA